MVAWCIHDFEYVMRELIYLLLFFFIVARVTNGHSPLSNYHSFENYVNFYLLTKILSFVCEMYQIKLVWMLFFYNVIVFSNFKHIFFCNTNLINYFSFIFLDYGEIWILDPIPISEVGNRRTLQMHCKHIKTHNHTCFEPYHVEISELNVQ